MPDLLERLKSALADRYAVESEIGRGGMAVVYAAEDLRHHRQVAIKILSPDVAAALGGERFSSEIEVAARLNHPHIVPLFDSGEVNGVLYYVMPLLDEGSLRSLLSRRKQLSVDEAGRIIAEVASGLDYAHEAGVIHRDVKPANVMFSGGEAMVADFGVAMALSAAGDQKLTATGLASLRRSHAAGSSRAKDGWRDPEPASRARHGPATGRKSDREGPVVDPCRPVRIRRRVRFGP